MSRYGEFDFIASIRERFGSIADNDFEGIGDDCSVLPIGNDESLLFTADMLNEGVHFLVERSSAYLVGYKSLMVNISDVAAMGAKPVATLLSLALPNERFGEWAEEFMRGYYDASAKYGVKLIGGDTTKAISQISINVTAIGRISDRCVKRRSAAKVGDVIMVSGRLGASAAGLRDVLDNDLNSTNASIHLQPEARVDEGAWLGGQKEVRAMADISDGVASDLQHIVDESKVSAILFKESIPIAEGATFADALCGGEDYELIFTVDADRADCLMQSFEARFAKPLYNIGKIVASQGERCCVELEEEGCTANLSERGMTGFSHF